MSEAISNAATSLFDPKWDEAVMRMPPMKCGRLDMSSYTAGGEMEKYVYVQGCDRTKIVGPYCDEIAYAAQRFTTLVQALRQIIAKDNYSRGDSLEAQLGNAIDVAEAIAFIECADIARAALAPTVPEGAVNASASGPYCVECSGIRGDECIACRAERIEAASEQAGEVGDGE